MNKKMTRIAFIAMIALSFGNLFGSYWINKLNPFRSEENSKAQEEAKLTAQLKIDSDNLLKKNEQLAQLQKQVFSANNKILNTKQALLEREKKRQEDEENKYINFGYLNYLEDDAMYRKKESQIAQAIQATDEKIKLINEERWVNAKESKAITDARKKREEDDKKIGTGFHLNDKLVKEERALMVSKATQASLNRDILGNSPTRQSFEEMSSLSNDGYDSSQEDKSSIFDNSNAAIRGTNSKASRIDSKYARSVINNYNKHLPSDQMPVEQVLGITNSFLDHGYNHSQTEHGEEMPHDKISNYDDNNSKGSRSIDSTARTMNSTPRAIVNNYNRYLELNSVATGQGTTYANSSKGNQIQAGSKAKMVNDSGRDENGNLIELD